MRKITVIGTGYVGLVSGTCFADVGNEVTCCDIDHSKIDLLNQGQIPIYEPGLQEVVDRNVSKQRLSFTTDIPSAIQEAEVIYIAVGTPMTDTGEADLTYVEAVAKTIGENLNNYKVIVNKSTVPVGTGKLVQDIVQKHLPDANLDFDVVSNPEFLREGSALDDCMNMDRAIIGATSEKAAQIIAELHKPFNTRILITNVESAEMIKYASNAFLATKISFINDIANICERVGADVTKVAEGMGLDSRIGHKFLQAGIGFGGSCFPKDTQALVHIASDVNYDFKIVKSVIETNNEQRMRVVEKLHHVLGDVRGKTIAVLGLAFKPNTDDVRYAPALDVIPELIRKGAVVKAYDPIALNNAKTELKDYRNIVYSTDLYETLRDSDACLVLTDWADVVEMDLEKVQQLLRLPIIIDGRNCFDLDEMKRLGFIYHSIGRPSVEGYVPVAQNVP